MPRLIAGWDTLPQVRSRTRQLPRDARRPVFGSCRKHEAKCPVTHVVPRCGYKYWKGYLAHDSTNRLSVIYSALFTLCSKHPSHGYRNGFSSRTRGRSSISPRSRIRNSSESSRHWTIQSLSSPHRVVGLSVRSRSLSTAAGNVSNQGQVQGQSLLIQYHDVIVDDHWRKAPETETVGYVPYASQSANEHDASTEDPAYHASLPLYLPQLPLILTQTPSSPTRRSHQAQSPAPPTNPTQTPYPPRAPSPTLPNSPDATSSSPSSLRSPQSPPSFLRPRTLTPLQRRFRRRMASTWTLSFCIAVSFPHSLQHTEGAQQHCTRSRGRLSFGRGRQIGTRTRRRSPR